MAIWSSKLQFSNILVFSTLALTAAQYWKNSHCHILFYIRSVELHLLQYRYKSTPSKKNRKTSHLLNSWKTKWQNYALNTYHSVLINNKFQLFPSAEWSQKKYSTSKLPISLYTATCHILQEPKITWLCAVTEGSGFVRPSLFVYMLYMARGSLIPVSWFSWWNSYTCKGSYIYSYPVDQ